MLAAAACASAVLAGCGHPPAPAEPIKLASAYVIETNGLAAVDAYLVIRNSGPADHLVRITSSAGGTVALRSYRAAGGSLGRTLSELAIPAHSTVRLVPSGTHLVITGSGPMPHGRDITLTLVFAHAGTLQIAAQVTNLGGSGGGSGFNDS